MPDRAHISKLEQQILDLTERLAALSQELSVLRRENTALKEENAALKAENAKLKAQLNQHSGNSSQPPSQDKPWQKTARRSAMPKPKGNNKGGQFGHDGRTLEMVAPEEADKVEPLPPKVCACCGEAFAAEAEGEVVARRQVFDVPDPKLHVTEYQRLVCTCGRCGHQQAGEFPPEVPSRAQYGPRAYALVNLLRHGYHLSYASAEQLFEDLFGQPINQRTQQAAEEACYENLADTEDHIRERLLASEVNHFDETGLRKRQMYLHVACNALYTLLFVHQKRGNQAIGSAPSILPAYRGRAIHDCWATYFMYDACRHGLCSSHLLRDLEAAIEAGRAWAKEMKALLWDLYQRSEQGTACLPSEEHPAVRKRYQAIVQSARKEEPPPEPKPPGKKGPPKASKSYNLMLRFDKHQAAVLAFAFEEAVPFTNNLAEQALRPAKTKVKVSGGFRTIEGAKRYARIQGFLDTARKNGQNALRELLDYCQIRDHYPPPAWC